jgi:hypothetical protein
MLQAWVTAALVRKRGKLPDLQAFLGNGNEDQPTQGLQQQKSLMVDWALRAQKKGYAVKIEKKRAAKRG